MSNGGSNFVGTDSNCAATAEKVQGSKRSNENLKRINTFTQFEIQKTSMDETLEQTQIKRNLIPPGVQKPLYRAPSKGNEFEVQEAPEFPAKPLKTCYE